MPYRLPKRSVAEGKSLRKASIWERFAFGWLTAGMFLFALAGHWLFGWFAYVSEQGEYSWLDRRAEADLLPTCERLGLSFIPHSPIGSGLLTGKIRRDRPPTEGTRLDGHDISEHEFEVVERLSAWAEAHGVSLLEVGIGGLAAVSPVATVIPGATMPEQVRANAAAGEWVPTEEELDELRTVQVA